MTPLASALIAAPWICNSPLSVPADPALTPLSPVTLTLTAQADGAFAATGTVLADDVFRPMTWTGRWSEIDTGFAMIGPWQHGDHRVEMRGFTTVAKADVLLLSLRETEHKGLTLRCLKEKGDA